MNNSACQQYEVILYTPSQQPCDCHTLVEIPDTNVGFKLLQKMGWSKGKGLGRQENGA